MKKKFFSAATFAVLFVFVSAIVQADTGETPPAVEGAKTVTPNDVKAVLGNAVVLDVRKRGSFLDGRLPGAKSIAAHFNAEKKSFDTAVFGANKSAPVIIYGHGTDGWSSVYAVRSAVAAGYTDVRWMRSGWASWVERKLPVEQ